MCPQIVDTREQLSTKLTWHVFLIVWLDVLFEILSWEKCFVANVTNVTSDFFGMFCSHVSIKMKFFVKFKSTWFTIVSLLLLNCLFDVNFHVLFQIATEKWRKSAQITKKIFHMQVNFEDVTTIIVDWRATNFTTLFELQILTPFSRLFSFFLNNCFTIHKIVFWIFIFCLNLHIWWKRMSLVSVLVAGLIMESFMVRFGEVLLLNWLDVTVELKLVTNEASTEIWEYMEVILAERANFCWKIRWCDELKWGKIIIVFLEIAHVNN